MSHTLFKLRQLWSHLAGLLDESGLRPGAQLSRLERAAHFWGLVVRSFVRNRCPVRASALAYGTLLALIPILAVAVSVTSSFLKNQGEESIDAFIEKMVASLTPPAPAGAATASSAAPTEAAPDNSEAFSSLARDQRAVAARKSIARQIHQFIQNTRSGTLGVTGSLALIFVAISMLARVEDTFNDIWGVARGRSWFMRIVLYWGVLSLVPLVIAVAVALANGSHLETTRDVVSNTPLVGPWVVNLSFQIMPVLLVCAVFTLFYRLMPNARVLWKPALAGGVTAGLLFHLNNLVSVLYVSRVVSNSRIYGSLGLVPVFMIGLYFSWLILLFGAQVAYAVQNRKAYLEEKQLETITPHGRELMALRLMVCVGGRFAQGQAAAGVTDLSESLAAPTRLVRQICCALLEAKLLVETAESGYVPARPLEEINCHDILLALRAGGSPPALPARGSAAHTRAHEVFEQILQAEEQAAAPINLQDLIALKGTEARGSRLAA